MLALLRPRPAGARPRARTQAAPPRRRGALVLFACAFALYGTVAAVLVFVFHFVMGDAVARVANASYALYSRDPHLGAIGFVWPPLPTLVLMPLLPFKAIFPVLVTRGFAANLATAAFMAGSVVQLRGAPRPSRCIR
ncbi:MAG: hypothetical protein E6G68_04770 [Actinobacteria bacterium]|nr:MAG: hypothetical protein E6G68_04770 [Actinomycetota bacterium]